MTAHGRMVQAAVVFIVSIAVAVFAYLIGAYWTAGLAVVSSVVWSRFALRKEEDDV